MIRVTLQNTVTVSNALKYDKLWSKRTNHCHNLFWSGKNMLKHSCRNTVSVLALSLAVGFLSVSPTQAEDGKTGFFGGLTTGATLYGTSEGDLSLNAAPNTKVSVDTDLEPGMRIGGSFGYRMHPQASLELEGYWGFNSLDHSLSNGTVSGTADGDVGQYGFFGNAYYHVPLEAPVQPYVGLGIGGLGYYSDDSHGGVQLAGQALVGIDIPLTDHLEARAGYRYTLSSLGEWEGNGRNLDYGALHSHSLDFGLRYRFGSGQDKTKTASYSAVSSDSTLAETSLGEEAPYETQTASRQMDLQAPDYDMQGQDKRGAVERLPLEGRPKRSAAVGLEEFNDPNRAALAPLDRAPSSAGDALIPPPPATGEVLERYSDEPFPGLPRYEHDPFSTGLEPALPGYSNAAMTSSSAYETSMMAPPIDGPYQVAAYHTGVPSYMTDGQARSQATQARTTGASSYGVQLASYKKEQHVEKGWQDLQNRHADLLTGMTPTIKKTSVPGKGRFHRLYIGNLDYSAAQGLCKSLRRRGQWCQISKI